VRSGKWRGSLGLVQSQRRLAPWPSTSPRPIQTQIPCPSDMTAICLSFARDRSPFLVPAQSQTSIDASGKFGDFTPRLTDTRLQIFNSKQTAASLVRVSVGTARWSASEPVGGFEYLAGAPADTY
jgi:hypothetical protein